MKIIVDEMMPKADTLFAQLGEVVSVTGRPFDKNCLQDANALMVRSVTPVDANLLKGTSVQFVGTATAGMDHIDVDSLEEAGVQVTSAAGCNAIAVVEYVFSCLFYFSQKHQFDLQKKTVGIVGVGHVGSILAKRLEVLGISVLLCDPPKARQEKLPPDTNSSFIDFNTLLEKADVLTFHTPLIKGGIDNTFHLLDSDKLKKLPETTIIINASRGEVIDNRALLAEFKQGKKRSVALDVFEHEPAINAELLAYIDIATPHIAGHTLEGKLRGTTILVEKLAKFLKQTSPKSSDKETINFLDTLKSDFLLEESLPEAMVTEITLNEGLNLSSLSRLAHLLYDVIADDKKFRHSMSLVDLSSPTEIATVFDMLRKNYQMRREWSSLTVNTANESSKKQLELLGFKTFHAIT